MDSKDVQLKIMAQAVYELRGLLGNYLGNKDPEVQSESVSAHLAYALHNEALAIIEDRPEDFDVDIAIKNVKRVDEIYGEQFGERFQKLISVVKT
jgi:hypothetical protein